MNPNKQIPLMSSLKLVTETNKYVTLATIPVNENITVRTLNILKITCIISNTPNQIYNVSNGKCEHQKHTAY